MLSLDTLYVMIGAPCVGVVVAWLFRVCHNMLNLI